MKTLSRISLFLLTVVLLSSCEKSYRFQIDSPKTASYETDVTFSIKEENNNEYEKVLFFVNGKEVTSQNGSVTLNTKDYGVGKQSISAMVYYGEGKSKRVNNTIEIFPNTEPTLYVGKIVNTFPHDPQAFTQGLQYKDGYIYESTGKEGKSTISKLNLKTGEVIQRVKLEDEYFGEGITILNDKLYSLTWRKNKGFVYDLATLKREKEFQYNRSRQGWGLTNNGKELIKSDGSHKIWFLDPENQQEIRSIEAYYNKGKIDKLNELEYINGKIYANRWITDKPIKSIIVIINPDNGVVQGIVNLRSVRDEVMKTQELTTDDVLNGIAYDTENNRLFVTGKNWNKLFEVELIKQ